MCVKELRKFLALLPNDGEIDFGDEYVNLHIQKNWYELRDDGGLIKYPPGIAVDEIHIGRITDLKAMKKEFGG